MIMIMKRPGTNQDSSHLEDEYNVMMLLDSHNEGKLN